MPTDYSLYDKVSGRCKVCQANTLWGDAPHHKDCEVNRIVEALLAEMEHWRNLYGLQRWQSRILATFFAAIPDKK